LASLREAAISLLLLLLLLLLAKRDYVSGVEKQWFLNYKFGFWIFDFYGFYGFLFF